MSEADSTSANDASPACRHCGDPLKMTVLERDPDGSNYWTHAHRLYRCQRKVTYGHNAAHPDVPCPTTGPNLCKCVYAPDATSVAS